MTTGQHRYHGRLDVALSASENNWAPAGIGQSTSIYITPTADWSITGILAESFASGGNGVERILALHNLATAFTISLPGLSVSSDVANRFAWSGTPTIGRGETAQIKYDTTASLWRLLSLGKVPAGAGGGTPGGADTQVQFNNAGAFGGDANLTWSAANAQLTATNLRAAARFNLTGDISVTLSSNPAADWAPSGHATSSVIKINPNTVAVSITGLVAPVSPYDDGKVIVILNVGAFAATVVDGSVTPAAANRFAIGGNLTIWPGQGMTFIYDGIAARWKALRIGPPTADSVPIVHGSADATKQLRFEVGGFTTATTRVLTPPNFDGTIATLAGTSTLTNKTLTSPAINAATMQSPAIITDGAFQGIKDQFGGRLVQMAGVTSAVNSVAVANATTGNGPTVQPGTGGDANVRLSVTGRGTSGVAIGVSGATRVFAGKADNNPATTDEGSDHYRTDMDGPFYYDSSRSKWLEYGKDTYWFGHSATNIAAGVGLRIGGLATGDGADANYRLPYACTMVGYSYTRDDFDSSSFEVMANASTVKLLISSGVTSESSLTTDIDFAQFDKLWVRVGTGAANTMNPRTFIIWMRRKAT